MNTYSLRTMRPIFFQLVCLLTAVFLLSGCDNSHKQIIGKWKSQGSETAWEFSGNGTLTTGGTPGRYNFGDNERIKIQTGAATFVYQFKIESDRMTLKDPSGSTMELTRVR